MRYLNLIRHIENWWVHFLVKLNLARTDPLLFRTRNRLQLEVPRRLLHEFKEIFLERCYVRGMTASMPERPTVVDLGANAGFFTIFAASLYPGARIVAYEPIPANFRQLERNRRLNPDARIRAYPTAVSGTGGSIELAFDSTDSFSTSATAYPCRDPKLTTLTVPCQSLPQVFEEKRIDTCDLLKIDCEGSEFDILYACPEPVLAKVRQMAVEVHEGPGPDRNIDALADFLEANRFRTNRDGHMLYAAPVR